MLTSFEKSRLHCAEKLNFVWEISHPPYSSDLAPILVLHPDPRKKFNETEDVLRVTKRGRVAKHYCKLDIQVTLMKPAQMKEEFSFVNIYRFCCVYHMRHGIYTTQYIIE